MTQVDFPYHFDRRGRTASPANQDEHIRDMIEQVLFTSPGERVNRADFGCGLLQLVFQPNSIELAAATELLVHSALDRWLGDLILVDTVDVEAEDSNVHITVRYVVRQSGTSTVADFTQGNPP